MCRLYPAEQNVTGWQGNIFTMNTRFTLTFYARTGTTWHATQQLLKSRTQHTGWCNVLNVWILSPTIRIRYNKFHLKYQLDIIFWMRLSNYLLCILLKQSSFHKCVYHVSMCFCPVAPDTVYKKMMKMNTTRKTDISWPHAIKPLLYLHWQSESINGSICWQMLKPGRLSAPCSVRHLMLTQDV